MVAANFRRRRMKRRDRKEKKASEGIGHVFETGLPPGVSIDQARDPGSQPAEQPGSGRRKGAR
jgi:hypothetical protein